MTTELTDKQAKVAIEFLMDGYYLSLVRSVLSEARAKVETAKTYSIQAGVLDTKQFDKVLASIDKAMNWHAEAMRQVAIKNLERLTDDS